MNYALSIYISTLSNIYFEKLCPNLPFIHNSRKIMYFNPSYSGIHLFSKPFPSFPTSHVGANERPRFHTKKKSSLNFPSPPFPSSSPWSPWLMGREHVYIALESDCRAGGITMEKRHRIGQGFENCRTNGAAAGVFAADHRRGRETKSGGDTRPTLTIRPARTIVQSRAH